MNLAELTLSGSQLFAQIVPEFKGDPLPGPDRFVESDSFMFVAVVAAAVVVIAILFFLVKRRRHRS